MKGLAIGSFARSASITLLVTMLLLCLLEGFASFAFALRRPPARRMVAERLHTEHDPLLGWINKPDLFVPHMYGRERYLKTNSQRLRSNYDFEIEVPAGRSRWVCSGNSFTFGYGVDNDDTWCALLGALVPGIEPVNMGQGGYGIDQAYLWYSRDGSRLQHDVLLFAFVTADLYRMERCEFANHPKPCLEVRAGEIVTRNVPVPEPDPDGSDPPGYRRLIESSKAVAAATGLIRRVGLASLWTGEERLHELAEAVLTELDAVASERAVSVLLLHLPVQPDYAGSGSEPLRSFLRSLAADHDWLYLDLIQDLRRLPPQELPGMFIQHDVGCFGGSRGHYSQAGNRFVAERVVERIRRHPTASALLPD